ncbi:MAG: hypothetical protein ACREJQ_00805, partial [bacterium]
RSQESGVGSQGTMSRGLHHRIQEPRHRPDAKPVKCPFCESTNTERLALFATVALTEQYHCLACNNYFEHVRQHPAPKM